MPILPAIIRHTVIVMIFFFIVNDFDFL